MIECGDIVEAEFINLQENHDYKVLVSAGDQLSLFARPLGTDLTLVVLLFNPTGTFVAGPSGYYRTFSEYSLDSGILGANGEYTIRVANHDWSDSNSGTGGVGVYSLEISCTLRDGTEIQAGEIPSDEPVSTDSNQSATAPVSAPTFGFPGIMPVDFADGIEIPILKDQAQTAPLGNDVALYTYSATSRESITLNVSRLSGDISIGVAVINRQTNEIVFVSGMPSSNDLSVTLIFPDTSDYVIGLFRLDTIERTGTTGAVQILLS